MAFIAQNYPSNANSTELNNPRGIRGGRSDQGGVGRRHNSAIYRLYVKCSYCIKDWYTHDECRKRKREELLRKSRHDEASAVSPPMQNLSLRVTRTNEDALRPNQDHSYISNSTCSTSQRSQDWFSYLGATQHMTDQRKFFKSFLLIEGFYEFATIRSKHMVR